MFDLELAAGKMATLKKSKVKVCSGCDVITGAVEFTVFFPLFDLDPIVPCFWTSNKEKKKNKGLYGQ